MEPDLGLAQVRDGQSFKMWSHGYPYRTARWRFHPDYGLHLVTSTGGDRCVGDHIGPFRAGDLVLVSPNLPHNWISNTPEGDSIEERCLVLQFTGEFMDACMATFPELRFVQPLLQEAFRGVRFEAAASERVLPLMRDLLEASGAPHRAFCRHPRPDRPSRRRSSAPLGATGGASLPRARGPEFSAARASVRVPPINTLQTQTNRLRPMRREHP